MKKVFYLPESEKCNSLTMIAIVTEVVTEAKKLFSNILVKCKVTNE